MALGQSGRALVRRWPMGVAADPTDHLFVLPKDGAARPWTNKKGGGSLRRPNPRSTIAGHSQFGLVRNEHGEIQQLFEHDRKFDTEGHTVLDVRSRIGLGEGLH
jgi:hypothetical protein